MFHNNLIILKVTITYILITFALMMITDLSKLPIQNEEYYCILSIIV